MRWIDAHREAMIVAADCHAELNLDTFQRVDVFAAFPALGVKLMFRPLRSCAALYMPAVSGGRPGALVNSHHPLALQRFSAAHELGHHRFDHGPKVDLESEPRLSGRDLKDEEKLAEAFAAWFLMPPELGDVIFEDILAVNRPRDPLDVYTAALRFGTSYTATCVHLVALKMLSATQSDTWLKLPLKSLKTGLSATAPPGGWRNDVIRVVEGDLGHRMLVRAGDRLLIDLAGDWQVDELAEGATVVAGSPQLTIDLAPEMVARPATIELSNGSATCSLRLDVQRPRLGLYVPPAPAQAGQ